MALINIDSQKQLFVDDYLIESMKNCAQVLNRAEKAADNPILRPEHPWEGGDVSINNVRWDDAGGPFEMRYTATQWKARRDKEHRRLPWFKWIGNPENHGNGGGAKGNRDQQCEVDQAFHC